PAQPVSASVAWVTAPRAESITPAEEIPTARIAAPPRTCSASSSAVSRIAAAPSVAGVATVATRSAWGTGEPPVPRPAPAPVTRAARILVPPRSRARTGSDTRALPQPGLGEDRPDPFDGLVLDRRHRGGHDIGREHPELAQRGLEGAHAGGRAHLADGLED